jgi:hypothetical protein
MIRLGHMAAAIGLVSFVGSCAMAPAPRTHMHGPRGQPMEDSAMPSRDRCPPDRGVHQMPGPHGGPMPDSAHAGCPPTQQQPNSDAPAQGSQPKQ